MSFKQVVKIVEAAAVAAALVFVIMLFANNGGGGGTESVGATIYSNNCASCHGADGGGGLGPKLAGVVTKDYPNIEDQIAFVSAGKNTMPAFEGELSEDELRAVVEYTRTELGG